MKRKWIVIGGAILLVTTACLLFTKERYWRLVYPDYLLFRSQIYKQLGVHNKYDIPDAKTFFLSIKLEHPGLERVRAAVKDGQFEKAIDEYFKWRSAAKNCPMFFDLKSIAKLGIGSKETVSKDYLKKLELSVSIGQYFLNNKIPYENHIYSLSDPPDYFPRKFLADILVNSFEYPAKYLGISYLLTKDDQYARKFSYYFRTWCKAAAPLPDPFVPGSLTHPQAFYVFTVARRMNSWIYAYYLLKESQGFDSETRFLMMREILAHAKYVDDSMHDSETDIAGSSNYRFWHEKTNAPLITSIRQAFTLIMFPEFIKQDEMLTRTLKMIDYHLSQNITAEGYQIERDTAYHEGSLVYLAELFLLANLNNIKMPKNISDVMEKNFDVLLRIIQPSGYLPAIGNAYLESNPSNFLALGAHIFKKPSLQHFAGPDFASPQMDFLTYGILYSYITNQRRPLQRIHLESDALPSTGFYVMRSGEKIPEDELMKGNFFDENLYLFFDLAPAYGHTHRDALNIIIAGYGSKPPYNLLDESGSSDNWSVNPLERYYQSPQAHNVIVIDGRVSPSWTTDPSPVCLKWVSTKLMDFVSGTYGRQYQNNTVTRNIFFKKGEYWILRDEIQGYGKHKLEQTFNFAPVQQECDDDKLIQRNSIAIDQATKTARTVYDGPNLVLIPTNPMTLNIQIHYGWKWHEKLAKCKPAANTFRDVRSPTLVYTKQADTTTPVIFETILYPLHYKETRRVVAERLPINGEDIHSVKHSAIRIEIGESNLKNRGRDKGKAKTDYFLSNQSTSHSLAYGDLIKFQGSHALISTSEGVPKLFCMTNGKDLSYLGYRFTSTGTDGCIKKLEGNRYLIDITSPIVFVFQTKEAIDASVKAEHRFPGKNWTALDLIHDQVTGVISTKIPGGYHEIRIIGI